VKASRVLKLEFSWREALLRLRLGLEVERAAQFVALMLAAIAKGFADSLA